MTDANDPRCVAVRAALAARGIDAPIVILPEAAPTAATAAAQLGVPVAAIANSLIFATAEGEPVLILTSGAHRVDVDLVAGLLGTASLTRATPDLVARATGQPIGGVAPVGHPAPLRTLVDVDLAGYDQVWAAAGIAHSVFATTFGQLLTLTGGIAAKVG